MQVSQDETLTIADNKIEDFDESILEVVRLSSKRSFGDYFLYFISIILLALAVFAFYKRNEILQNIFPSAHAQELIKKKV